MNIKGMEECMRFPAEIKETLAFQMHRVHSVLFRVANRLINEAAIPIKMEQLPVFLCIHTEGFVSQQEIADLVGRDKSSIQRTVVALESKGLIHISQDKKDKRKNILRTTEAGVLLAQQIKEIIEKVEEEIFVAFDSDDRRNTINSIKETADKLEAIKN